MPFHKIPYFVIVLIVAKCIVNLVVYKALVLLFLVLIVAKCIVNLTALNVTNVLEKVLIVAKCIVNQTSRHYEEEEVLY